MLRNEFEIHSISYDTVQIYGVQQSPTVLKTFAIRKSITNNRRTGVTLFKKAAEQNGEFEFD